jgi:hypothetical protein
MRIQKIHLTKTFYVIMALIIPFAMLANVQAAKEGTQTVEGTILSYQPEASQLALQAQTGQKLVLAVSSDFDFSKFAIGDKVIIEYSKDMVLQSMKKQG